MGCFESWGWGCVLQKLCEGRVLCPPTGVTQAEAPLLPGPLQLIPLPACFHAVSFSQVLQLLQGQTSSSNVTWALPGAFLVFYLYKVSCFITKVSLPEAD